jgi:hypothetical protein
VQRFSIREPAHQRRGLVDYFKAVEGEARWLLTPDATGEVCLDVLALLTVVGPVVDRYGLSLGIFGSDEIVNVFPV